MITYDNETVLDTVDEQIIEHLRQDGRKSFRQIAKELELSVGTITNRVTKLRETGIIKGFDIELDYQQLGYNIKTIINIQSAGNIQAILQKREYQDHIVTAHSITGEYNTILQARFKDPEDLNHFLKRLNDEEKIEKTNTQLILESLNN